MDALRLLNSLAVILLVAFYARPSLGKDTTNIHQEVLDVLKLCDSTSSIVCLASILGELLNYETYDQETKDAYTDFGKMILGIAVTNLNPNTVNKLCELTDKHKAGETLVCLKGVWDNCEESPLTHYNQTWRNVFFYQRNLNCTCNFITKGCEKTKKCVGKINTCQTDHPLRDAATKIQNQYLQNKCTNASCSVISEGKDCLQDCITEDHDYPVKVKEDSNLVSCQCVSLGDTGQCGSELVKVKNACKKPGDPAVIDDGGRGSKLSPTNLVYLFTMYMVYKLL